jgi:hypothetical protein
MGLVEREERQEGRAIMHGAPSFEPQAFHVTLPRAFMARLEQGGVAYLIC